MVKEKHRIDARVVGRVQGVGFRYFVIQQARRLGVSGWVRNESDGSVRVVAEGSRDVLDDFLKALQRGPTAARVGDLQVEWTSAQNGFAGFTVKHY